jgi:acetyl esterase/lipase
MANKTGHESLQPLHPSVAPHLDPTFADLYNEHVANTPNRPIDLALLRSKYSVLYSYGQAPGPEVGRVYDSTVEGHDGAELAVRVYEPATKPVGGVWPVHVDYHGGGWGLGDLDTEAHICRHICAKAEVVVIDVAYRLVPENIFHIGILDSFAALKAIYENAAKFNGEKESISIGGVSAGGTIALILAHLARDANIPLKLVATGTPTADDLSKYSSPTESPYPSMTYYEFAPTLNWARLKWFDDLKWSTLSKDPEERKKQAEEIGWYRDIFLAPDMKNLPKTLIYTGGCDPLRDEGEAYGRKLVEHGNEVSFKRFPGVPHPFMHMDKGKSIAANK